MTGFKVEADVSQGIDKLRKLGLTFEEVRKEVRAVNGDLSKLPVELREAAKAMDTVFQGHLRTKVGGSLQRRLVNRIGWNQNTANRSLWNINPDRLSDQPGVGQAILHGHMRESGVPMARSEGEEEAGGAGGGGSGFLGKLRGTTAWKGLKMGAGIGLGALGITTIASTVSKAISAGMEQDIGVSKLLRSTGDLSTTFEQLSRITRDVGDGLRMSQQESVRVMGIIAHGANIRDPGRLGREMQTAAGLANVYGLDRSQTAGQIADMRFLGAGGSDRESGDRKLALLIGETINKSGMFAKADQVMQMMGNFLDRNVGDLIHLPNLEGFSSMFAQMNSDGAPGLKGQNAANLIAQIDQAIKGGGARGEASQVFMYGALGQRDPFKSEYLQQEGMFGSEMSAFGKRDQQGNLLSGQHLSEKTNFEKIMARFKNASPDNYRALDALQGVFGTSMQQNQALIRLMQAPQMHLGKLSSSLSNAGISLQSLNPEALGELTNLYSGNKGALQGVAGRFMNRKDVTDEDKQAAGRAAGNMDYDALAREIGKYGIEKTQGEKIESSMAAVQNALTTSGSLVTGPLFAIATSLWGQNDKWKTTFLTTSPEIQSASDKRQDDDSKRKAADRDAFYRLHPQGSYEPTPLPGGGNAAHPPMVTGIADAFSRAIKAAMDGMNMQVSGDLMTPDGQRVPLSGRTVIGPGQPAGQKIDWTVSKHIGLMPSP